jgi:hypothetical protein
MLLQRRVAMLGGMGEAKMLRETDAVALPLLNLGALV